MYPSLQIDAQAVQFFDKNIRKERRRWETRIDHRPPIVLRYGDGTQDMLREIAILRYITSFAPQIKIPAFSYEDDKFIQMQYIFGVRAATAFTSLQECALRTRNAQA